MNAAVVVATAAVGSLVIGLIVGWAIGDQVRGLLRAGYRNG